MYSLLKQRFSLTQSLSKMCISHRCGHGKFSKSERPPLASPKVRHLDSLEFLSKTATKNCVNLYKIITQERLSSEGQIGNFSEHTAQQELTSVVFCPLKVHWQSGHYISCQEREAKFNATTRSGIPISPTKLSYLQQKDRISNTT